MTTESTRVDRLDVTGARVSSNAIAVGVPRRLAWWLFWAPVVGAVVVAATYARRSVYYWLLAEDHPFEWLQFALVLGGSLLAAATAWRLRREHDTLGALLFALFAVGLFVIAGEEISWGQRVFAFGTPADLASVNNEREFNIHDITKDVPLQSVFKLVELMLGLVGFVVPLYLARTRRVLRRRGWHLLVPPLFLVPSFALVFAYRLGRFLTDSHRYAAVVRFQEWPELALYFGLAAVAFLAYEQVAHDGYHGSHRSPEEARRRPTSLSLGVACCTALLTVAFAIATIVNGIAPGNPVDS
jgi:hypothetical protein